MSEEPEIENIDVSQLKKGPIRHESLPDGLSEAIKFSYDTVGHYITPTLEQWETEFMRVSRPEKEVHTWVRIARSWHLYHEGNATEKVLSDEHEKKLVTTLVLISMGVIEAEKLTLVTEPEGMELVQCWSDVFERLKDATEK